MEETITLTINLDKGIYKDIRNLIGYCQMQNLIIGSDLPTTDEEVIGAAMFHYFNRMQVIVKFFDVKERALKIGDEKIKNRFKEILEFIGMKQKDLAALTGIDDATISTILSNKNQPSIEYFLRIWVVLGCPPIEDIFYRTGSNPSILYNSK